MKLPRLFLFALLLILSFTATSKPLLKVPKVKGGMNTIGYHISYLMNYPGIYAICTMFAPGFVE